MNTFADASKSKKQEDGEASIHSSKHPSLIKKWGRIEHTPPHTVTQIQNGHTKGNNPPWQGKSHAKEQASQEKVKERMEPHQLLAPWFLFAATRWQQPRQAIQWLRGHSKSQLGDILGTNLFLLIWQPRFLKAEMVMQCNTAVSAYQRLDIHTQSLCF